MTNCKDCIFSEVRDFVRNYDFYAYKCLLLTKVAQRNVSIDINITNGVRDKFICPYFCSKENTINVFTKVHKKQFAKADLKSLYIELYGGLAPNED